MIFQVEGERPQTLRAGDAYYEPTGPRIMRFDNASATGENIFMDLCPEQKDEPFLIFEKNPTEFIDRRAMNTLTFDSVKLIDQIEIFEYLLEPNGRKNLTDKKSLVITGYYVVEGEVELAIKGKSRQKLKRGEIFYSLSDYSLTSLVNVSNKTAAKIIAFDLQ